MERNKKASKKNALNDLLSSGVAEYTGRPVRSLERFDDPNVQGSYALRVVMDDTGETLDFLIGGDREHEMASAADVAQVLEEAQFSTWPPTCGRPRFAGW